MGAFSYEQVSYTGQKEHKILTLARNLGKEAKARGEECNPQKDKALVKHLGWMDFDENFMPSHPVIMAYVQGYNA